MARRALDVRPTAFALYFNRGARPRRSQTRSETSEGVLRMLRARGRASHPGQGRRPEDDPRFELGLQGDAYFLVAQATHNRRGACAPVPQAARIYAIALFLGRAHEISLPRSHVPILGAPKARRTRSFELATSQGAARRAARSRACPVAQRDPVRRAADRAPFSGSDAARASRPSRFRPRPLLILLWPVSAPRVTWLFLLLTQLLLPLE